MRLGSLVRSSLLLSALLAGIVLSACVTDPLASRGKSVVEAYRQALERRDAERLWALSDASFRAVYSPEDLSKLLASDPGRFDRVAGDLTRADVDRATLLVPRESLPTPSDDARGGSEGVASVPSRAPGDAVLVHLVPEGDAYRIQPTWFESAGEDTPTWAIRTLFRGLASHDAHLVRSVMPDAQQPLYASDDELWSHLAVLGERLLHARSALAVLRAAPGEVGVAVRGSSATVVYGYGVSIRLVREGGRWRVLDVD